MIFTCNLKNLDKVDSTKYLRYLLLKDSNGITSYDSVLKSLTPPWYLIENLSRNEISKNSFLNQYRDYLYNIKDNIYDVAELLSKISKMMNKDIVLLGKGDYEKSERKILAGILSDILKENISELY